MKRKTLNNINTAWKVSKYGAFPGPYFLAFSPNAGKDGPEKTPYLDIFHEVLVFELSMSLPLCILRYLKNLWRKPGSKQLRETIVS